MANTIFLQRESERKITPTINQTKLKGRIKWNFNYSHLFHNSRFYKSKIEVTRRDGTIDEIPILVSEETFEKNGLDFDLQGELVEVRGRLCSYDVHVKNKDSYDYKQHHLSIFLAVESIEKISSVQRNNNSIHITGQVCNGIIVKKTKVQRKKANFFVRTLREDGKRDFIPCLAFDEVAEYVEQKLHPTARIELKGSLTSKLFIRENFFSPNKVEQRTAYEILVGEISLI